MELRTIVDKARAMLFVLVGLLVVAGCSDDTFEKSKPTHPHEFSLSRNSMEVAYTAGFANINMSADMAISWTATCSADWLSVTPTSATGGGNVCVSWEANEAAADREATVTFSEGQRSVELKVKQGQKPAELLSYRAIMGNLVKYELDSVEFVFDKPVGWAFVTSNSEFYAIDTQAEKMDDEGYCWRVPLKIASLGSDILLAVHYKSKSDWKEHVKGLSVPFYQKKYKITHETEWITFSTLSLDKKSLWIALDNWETDRRRLVQLSLDDMTEMKSVKLPYAACHLCMNPYNGLLYAMGNEDFFCVVDPAKGEIVKRVEIETSPYAHPQYPTNYASEVAFTKDGFGVLRLISDGSTGLEWRYIDSANGDKITLSGEYNDYDFEHLYVNYDQTRIYASMYPSLFSPLTWVNRLHQKPVEVNISAKFQSDKYYAGGNLMDLQMSPFANKAFFCTAPGSQCVVGLDPLSYSEVCEIEARGAKCAWDATMKERDYVYQVCTYDGYFELFDMTEGDCIFASCHRFFGSNEAKICHFLPASDELVVSALDGVWLFDAKRFREKGALN